MTITRDDPPQPPLLGDFLDATEATAIFERVARCHLLRRPDDAAAALRDDLADHDNTDRRLCELTLAGAITTARLINRRHNPEGALWTMRPAPGDEWPSDMPVSDLAAMRILTALLNHDIEAGRELIQDHATIYGTIGAKGILAATLSAYVKVVGR